MKFEVKEEIVETEEWSMDNVMSESELKTENFSLAQVWRFEKLQFFIIVVGFSIVIHTMQSVKLVVNFYH